MPDPTPDSDRGLPAEIKAAIGVLKPRQRNLAEAIAQIVEPILSRLTAAEAERDRLRTDLEAARVRGGDGGGAGGACRMD